MDGRDDTWVGWCMGECTDGWIMDGWIDGWMDVRMYV